VSKASREAITTLQAKQEFALGKTTRALCEALKSFMENYHEASGEARISFR